MAPALTLTPREPPDALHDADDALSLPRRAFTSVDNLSTHMDEDDMGLQHQPSLVKDSQEMEQILVDLGGGDLAPADLFQAIKTLESGTDGLSTGDADAIFPGFDLAEAVDSEGDAVEDKIRLMQTRLERRCAFLQRRLRILQARAIGKRISEEAAQTFDKCIRGARKDGGGRPMGLKALLKKIETTAALQASAANRSSGGPSYYNAGTSKGDASKAATLGIPSGTLTGLEETAGALRSHLSIVKHQLDSDATASSSGAESNDEAVNYNNLHQQHMPIEKRALWSWQRARASIASRWTWLQAQVQELDYKIRQHNDLHKQVREAKGAVQFVGEPAAYQGSLPGADWPDDPETATCARARPLRRDSFKKRKLLQMHNLHIATSKAAKPADIDCGCEARWSCPVCCGRGSAQAPLPAFSTLPAAARVALVDPAYHHVLSEPAEIAPSVHTAALTCRPWLRARLHKSPRAERRHNKLTVPHPPPSAPTPTAPKLKRGRPPSRKIREARDHNDYGTTHTERGRHRGSTEQRRRASFDIDNIVIPASVAANNRPHILTYKEIQTPKWRMMDVPRMTMNNGVSKPSYRMSMDSEEEDTSESTFLVRHARAEVRERARYTRTRRQRTRENDAVTSHLPTLPTLPTPNVPPVELAAVAPREVVRPYSPRQFPLPEEVYSYMLSSMPEGHGLDEAFEDHSPHAGPHSPHAGPHSPHAGPHSPHIGVDDDDSSTISSPPSPLVFDGDDPDDVEWDPTSEKSERRKSGFR